MSLLRVKLMNVADLSICHCTTPEATGARQSPIGMTLCTERMAYHTSGLMVSGLGILRMELKRAIMPQS